MIIVPTRECNTNNCNYCSVYKKDFDFNYFDNLDLEFFFEKVEIISGKTLDFELRFFGGEAFIKFKIIKEIIIFFKQKTDKYNFTINTNLSILDEEKIDFIKKNEIKLIISCNGKLKDHSKSRGINIKQTLQLYKNIKKVIKNNISHQINIVCDNNSANNLVENLEFIEKFLGGKNINLLPVNYNGWSEKGLQDLEKSFEKLSEKLLSGETKINFINKDIKNEVPLFNSEFVIDSDGKVYPSMIILETFFLKEKGRILISDCNKETKIFKEDIYSYEPEHNKIYSKFINNFLEKKFANIIKNDLISSQLFHTFLQKI